MSPIVQLIIIACVLVGLWYAAERFAPDGFIQLLCKLAIFAIAVYVIATKVFPMIGI